MREREGALSAAVGFTEVVTDLLLLAPAMSPRTPSPVKSAMGAAAGGKEAIKSEAEAVGADVPFASVLAEVVRGLAFEAVVGRGALGRSVGGDGDGAETTGASLTTAVGLGSYTAAASVAGAEAGPGAEDVEVSTVLSARTGAGEDAPKADAS